jgi:hypothetical protein
MHLKQAGQTKTGVAGGAMMWLMQQNHEKLTPIKADHVALAAIKAASHRT